MELDKYKNKKIDEVIDEIKVLHPIVRIVYERGMITADHRPERLNIYVNIRSEITGFDWG